MNTDQLTESVKAKILAMGMDLLPQKELEQTIENELDSFFNGEKKYYDASRREFPLFRVLVKNELEKELIRRVNEYFKTEKFDQHWNNEGKVAIDAAMEKIFVANSAEILKNFFTKMFSEQLVFLHNHVDHLEQSLKR